MIRSLLTLLAATALSGAAMAADVPVPAPGGPINSPILSRATSMDWSGFHIGLQGGYGHSRIGDGLWLNNRYSAFEAVPGRLSVGGWTGGIRAGYDVQFGNGLVLGGLLEGNLADLDKEYRGDFFGFPHGVKTRISNYGLASARIGYAWNEVLFYGTVGGGLASTEVRAYDSLFNTYLKASPSQSGWSVGGGVDYAINPNLVLGVGYRYLDLGNKTVFGGTTADTRVGGQIQSVQGSISFKY